MVDFLAKEATLTTVPKGDIPATDFGSIWRREAREKTFERNIQEGDDKGKYYFHNYINLGSKPWFHRSGFSRWEIVTINRLRADHYSAAASLFRKNIVSSPSCKCGAELQDANHLLWQCRDFCQERTVLLSDLSKFNVDKPYLIENILMDLNFEVLRTLLKFFKICKLNM